MYFYTICCIKVVLTCLLALFPLSRETHIYLFAERLALLGHFACGNLSCDTKDELRSWEVLFSYKEGGEQKSALVKLRLCPPCSAKLNHKSDKKHKKEREAEEKAARERDEISKNSFGPEPPSAKRPHDQVAGQDDDGPADKIARQKTKEKADQEEDIFEGLFP